MSLPIKFESQEEAVTGTFTSYLSTTTLKLNTLFVNRGLDNQFSFQLATEMDNAEAFDGLLSKLQFCFDYGSQTRDLLKQDRMSTLYQGHVCSLKYG
jgi:hypothetical protein